MTQPTAPSVGLIETDLPAFGLPSSQPQIPASVFAARLAEARRRVAAAGCDALVVYGDREHAANVAYLTGYDPRFEETLLVVVPGRRPVLMLGNEGFGFATLAAGDFDRVLCQSFSLPGQPRDRQLPLGVLLAEAGLTAGMRVGCVGWKMFDAGDPGADEGWLDLPDFIAGRLRAVVGPGVLVNLARLFIDPADGMRATSEVDQLACFEFAASFGSEGLRRVLFGIREGMSELEACALMGANGLPLAAHTMLSAGARAVHGLPSPSMDRIALGAPITMAYAPQGSLTARAGFLATDAGDLPEGIRDYVDKLAAPYFGAIAEWYGAIGIGVEGGVLFDIIHRHLGDGFFGVGLNPGHLIHLDEWMHSPIFAGSRIALRSGMAIQLDVIPATHSPWFTTNIEDGIALADAALREEFAARYPEAWERIGRRRAFMGEVLGIRLKPDVLPFSNIPAYLPPFWLSPRRVLALKT